MNDKALIVDDDAETRRNLKILLEKENFTALVAENGAEGLRIATENPDLKLIFTDFHMPTMNGLEMVDAIRKSKVDFAKVPIIVLTTETDSQIRDWGRQLSVRTWILKPFNPVLVQMCVQRLLKDPKESSAV